MDLPYWKILYEDGETVEGMGTPVRDDLETTGVVACANYNHPDYPQGHIAIAKGTDYYYWCDVNALWVCSNNEGEMLRHSVRGTCVLESAPMMKSEKFKEVLGRLTE